MVADTSFHRQKCGGKHRPTGDILRGAPTARAAGVAVHLSNRAHAQEGEREGHHSKALGRVIFELTVLVNYVLLC